MSINYSVVAFHVSCYENIVRNSKNKTKINRNHANLKCLPRQEIKVLRTEYHDFDITELNNAMLLIMRPELFLQQTHIE